MTEPDAVSQKLRILNDAFYQWWKDQPKKPHMLEMEAQAHRLINSNSLRGFVMLHPEKYRSPKKMFKRTKAAVAKIQPRSVYICYACKKDALISPQAGGCSC